MASKQPSINLDVLLRRRKTTFKAWVESANISSYGEVMDWCGRIGVVPPTREEWDAVRPVPVNAPTQGIVVVETPPVTPEPEETQVVAEQAEQPDKAPRKKKTPTVV